MKTRELTTREQNKLNKAYMAYIAERNSSTDFGIQAWASYQQYLADNKFVPAQVGYQKQIE